MVVSRPIRSARCSGPIGCAQPSTMPVSMSSAVAKPDSIIRIADSRYGISSALTTNPARSWRGSPACRADVGGEAARRGRPSPATSAATGHQFDQAQHRHRVEEVDADRPARAAWSPSPSFMIGIDDVFDGEDRRRGRSPPCRAASKTVTFAASCLDDRLDDDLTVGEIVEVGGERQPAERGVAIVLASACRTRRPGRATSRSAPARPRRRPRRPPAR